MPIEFASHRPRIAVHKFSSCDGCQLAFLNLGDALLDLTRRADIVHFAEAGIVAEDAAADIAFVEGSIATSEDEARIRRIRDNSALLVTIGACATAGGIQALRNLTDSDEWVASVYARPEHIDALAKTVAIREKVSVDLELWGCPVTSRQVVDALTALLAGAPPRLNNDPVCLDCKRQGNPCVLVAGQPCLGPVTRSGCGALCPGQGRACYGCFGPSPEANTRSIGEALHAQGLSPSEVARRFLFINSGAAAFGEAGAYWKDRHD